MKLTLAAFLLALPGFAVAKIDSNPVRLVAKASLNRVRSLARRAARGLDQDWDWDDDEDEGDDFLSSLFGGPDGGDGEGLNDIMEIVGGVAQCGLDIEGILNAVMGDMMAETGLDMEEIPQGEAFDWGEDGPIDVPPPNPEDEEGGGWGRKRGRALDDMDGMSMELGMEGGMGDFDIMDLFLPKDEKVCSKKGAKKMVSAFDDFAQCTGWDMMKLGDDEAASQEFLDTMDNIQDKCGDLMDGAMDAATGFSPLGGSASMMMAAPENAPDLQNMEGMDECTDAILGDNPLGDWLRDYYLHPDKVCQCYANLGDAVPECAVTSGSLVTKVTQMTKMLKELGPVDENSPVNYNEDEPSVSGSMIKMLSCLEGVFCGALENVCASSLMALDTCLPQMGMEGEATCEDVVSQCTDAGALFLALPEQMMGLPLPDMCLRVYEERDLYDMQIPARYDAFSAGCYGVEEVTETEEEAYEEMEEEYEEEEEEEAASLTTTSMASVHQKSASHQDAANSSAVVPIACVAIVAIVAAMVMVRRRNRSSDRVGATRVPAEDDDEEEHVLA